MYSVGDDEQLGEHAACRVIHHVAAALTELLDAVFRGVPWPLAHKDRQQGFHDIVGNPFSLYLQPHDTQRYCCSPN